jgi:signal transduction histidine kinase/ligand-binding sensor domain-containing protein
MTQPRHLIILFLLQTACLCAFPQRQPIKFEHISTNLGLSQSSVLCIFQDSRGFMWFGTRDGLNKYDGYKFTVYKNDVNNSSSLAFNAVYDITEDGDGNMWIATWGGGLDMFDWEKEIFVHHRPDPKDPFSIGSIHIDCLLNDREGNLWIGTEGHGLQWYDKKNDRFISYSHDDHDPRSISGDRVQKIVEDADHDLWIATNRGGLNLFDRQTKTFTHFRHDEKNPNSLSTDETWTLFIDSRGQLWVGTHGEGLDRFDWSTSEFRHFKNNPLDNSSLPSNSVRTINEDDHGNLWIGTENGGLSTMNRENSTFENYFQDDVDPASLSNNSVYAVCKDKKGDMWVGMASSGINFVNADANNFVYYRHNSSPASLSNNIVLSIFEDKEDHLWIGTDGGGVNLFDPAQGNFKHYMHDPTNKNSICANYVLSICEDHDDNMWFGTWGQGLTVYNKKKDTYKQYKFDPTRSNGLSSSNIWNIFVDRDGDVWLSTYGGGICKYDKAHDGFIRYVNNPSNPFSVGSNYVNFVTQDREGNIWVGTNGGGLDLFDKSSGTFSHRVKEEGRDPISDDNIFCLAEDMDGNLWVGTTMGLNFMNRKTGAFTNYFLKDGLPSNAITGLLVDDKGKLWISTFKGLARFDPLVKTFSTFGINDGLQSNEFKMNSCFKSRSGRLYFGGIGGFNGFYPDSVKEKNYDPPLVITHFQILNKEVSVSSSDDKTPLKKNIADTRELTLSHDQSVITFEFASLNYALQDEKQYSYKLDNFDKDWNYVGSRHTATYTNLDPGKYVFIVRGMNNNGSWSTTTATIALTITPPFWKTWWFEALGLLLTVGGAVAFFKFRFSIIQAQRTRLQQQVQEQTKQLLQSTQEEHKARREAEQANKELERKNRELEQFAYVASHDLQEPLRTTSSFVKLFQEQFQGQLDERADKYLTYIVQSSDRMKVLITDLLEYSRIGSKKELQQVDCNVMLREVLTDIGAAINDAGAKIEACELPVISGYPTEIKQLFQNLTINAIKFRRPDTIPRITISAVQNENNWQFAFADNGIGIEEQHSERIFIIFQRLHTRNEYPGSGIGLSHCKKIVELHKGKIWLESTLGQGSTFYFTIANQ